MKNSEQFVRSGWAGIFIAIAAQIYLQVGGVVGALQFSIGLLLILNFECSLYTGIIGYVRKPNQMMRSLFILQGNIVGTWILQFIPHPNAANQVLTKLDTPLQIVLFKAIICGVLIYQAVESHKIKRDDLVVLCVAAFILFGAEHCVADQCYIVSARIFNWQSGIFFLVTVLGNSIGSQLISFSLKR